MLHEKVFIFNVMFMALLGPVFKILEVTFFFLFQLTKTEVSLIYTTDPEKFKIVLWEKEIQK